MKPTSSRPLVAALVLGVSSLALAGTETQTSGPAKEAEIAACGCCGPAAVTAAQDKDGASSTVCHCGNENEFTLGPYDWTP